MSGGEESSGNSSSSEGSPAGSSSASLQREKDPQNFHHKKFRAAAVHNRPLDDDDEAERPAKRHREGDEADRPAKRHREDKEKPSDIGWKLMQMAGYKKGEGLGAKRQGRTEPVELSTQLGRRGLGATVPQTLRRDLGISWDASKEELSVEEHPDWMDPCTEDAPTKEELISWLKIGHKKLRIEDETEFCSEETLTAMLKSKSVFDELNDRDLRNARTRANPFETIKGAFFQNRAAMKTANMDAVFDWFLTDPPHPDHPEDKDRVSWVPIDCLEPSLYYFADICAGPGGFTEYLLWKRSWSAHGFGFTLKGQNDFRLDQFLAASPEMFEPFYGVSGLEGDGDITNPFNLRSFEDFVRKSTPDGAGLHLVMADGGFSVEGQENIQEILSKRIYLCQFLCAISVLRPGGSFLCKLFDLFTEFSAGLIYLMYRIFDQITIHKPHSSRPANSERYIFCRGMNSRGSILIREYLHAVNEKLDSFHKDSDQDVVSVVPLDVIKEDTAFFEYLYNSNEKWAQWQTKYLNKYRVFAQNSTLLETRQGDLRSDCLKHWRIPDESRQNPPRPAPSERFSQLCQNNREWMIGRKRQSPPFNNKDQLHIVHNWSGLDFRCSVACEDYAHIILALGKTFIFKWEGTRWDRLEMNVMLPKDTIILAETSFVYWGRGKGLQKKPILRILDAYYLGGKNVGALLYAERMANIRRFCMAISHELSRKDLALVRPAEFWKLKDFWVQTRQRFSTISNRGSERLCLQEPVAIAGESQVQAQYLICRGLYLNRIVNDNWFVCWSKSKSKVFFSSKPPSDPPPHNWSPVSIFDDDWKRHPELVLTFQQAYQKRLLWDWTKADNVKHLLEESPPDELSIPDVCKFVTEIDTSITKK